MRSLGCGRMLTRPSSRKGRVWECVCVRKGDVSIPLRRTVRTTPPHGRSAELRVSTSICLWCPCAQWSSVERQLVAACGFGGSKTWLSGAHHSGSTPFAKMATAGMDMSAFQFAPDDRSERMLTATAPGCKMQFIHTLGGAMTAAFPGRVLATMLPWRDAWWRETARGLGWRASDPARRRLGRGGRRQHGCRWDEALQRERLRSRATAAVREEWRTPKNTCKQVVPSMHNAKHAARSFYDRRHT